MSKRRLSARLVSRLLVTACRLLTGIRSRWHSEPDAGKNRIYFANHSSHLDGLVIWASLPKPLRDTVHPVAAADYWLGSRLRRYLALQVFRAVLVERRSAATAQAGAAVRPDPLEPLKQALAQQHSLILFPEGTRGDGEQLNRFKSGLYHLSKAWPEVELVPVWLDNLNRVLPKGSRLVVPIICSATFGSPLPGVQDGEDKQAFLDRTQSALEALAP
ncbi:1-acyl-sn-glycerol-3-phosphate acyltransferase [Erwinia sp. B116]|uniref:lysophospholipid acyltransferase family protein n=1 Tax=Erwinia sp. B116 TaxID=1561024 RepID=UPI000C759914|nr:lysophospholipid acyltransferase family protein [Erwinia sp. B116]PLV55471.1 acyl-phosphate glycerol 3-phosphate acyltransferase [Erwinia sp. B116]